MHPQVAHAWLGKTLKMSILGSSQEFPMENAVCHPVNQTKMAFININLLDSVFVKKGHGLVVWLATSIHFRTPWSSQAPLN
jgi:hypothetical protein